MCGGISPGWLMLSVKEESCNSVPYFRRGGAGDINIHVDVHTYIHT